MKSRESSRGRAEEGIYYDFGREGRGESRNISWVGIHRRRL